MKDTFKSSEKFNTLLFSQRHECRSKRQKLRIYGMSELYQELSEEYQLFKDYLPSPLQNVLDIGCGLGYIDVVLFDQHPNLKLHMFDAAAEVKGKVDLFYNDLNLTKEFLMLNDVPASNITLIDATSTGNGQHDNQNPEIFKSLPKMDLVISMYAWGWHSRITKFIKEVSEVLRPGGRFIIEVKGEITADSHQDNLQKISVQSFKHLKSIQINQGRYLLIAERT